ncbi:carbohydrate ABC transporter permease [Flaviflexus equikiangi]|uniref:Carbohydrate ABC transporter permease n=1 Tax=Flaviflexus equikiangi TaxID=2758573 RepID=A0ABS2TKH6_9ACTO|nr:carbohydrate ABC transporter permease [Flaviflexus equikiangi]MBM9433784.1 carbohydrate ABC transporter permease [Flaviflexus equikiangi]
MAHRERLWSFLILCIFAISSLYPILSVFLRSLDSTVATDHSWGHVENYATAWDDGNFSLYMKNSVMIAVLVVSTALILSIMTGYVLGVIRPKGGNVIFFIFLAGMMVPSEAIVIPLFFDLNALGLTDTIWAVAFPQIAQSLAFGTFWMRAYFRNVSPSIVDAARMDGASEWQVLWKVLIPMGRPAIVTQIMITFMWTWNDFLIPLVMSPTGKFRTAPMSLAFFETNHTSSAVLMAAAAVLVAAPMIILYVFLQKYFIAGMTEGAVKE